MPQTINIIGAGVIGASLAFHLSRAGAKVTVFEAAKPAAAASGHSFGWINASFYASPAHHRLRAAAIAAHHRLATLLPDPAPNWQGCLWFEDDAALDQMAADLAALDYPVEPLTQAQIAAAEPQLANPPARALRFPAEGATDAAALTRALLAASGARVLAGLAVKTLINTAGQITGLRSPIGPFLADHTILVAGTGTPALLASLGLRLPMLTRPGLILHTNPVPWRLHHILATPQHEIRQDPTGRLIAPAAANHQADSAETVPDPQSATAATLAQLRTLFADPQITLQSSAIGYRPVPGDGLPVVGQVLPGLSVAVMHSGVTLAPLIGEALAAEITGQGEAPLLANFRPARLLTAI